MIPWRSLLCWLPNYFETELQLLFCPRWLRILVRGLSQAVILARLLGWSVHFQCPPDTSQRRISAPRIRLMYLSRPALVRRQSPPPQETACPSILSARPEPNGVLRKINADLARRTHYGRISQAVENQFILPFNTDIVRRMLESCSRAPFFQAFEAGYYRPDIIF